MDTMPETEPLRVLVVDEVFIVARVHRRFVERVPGFWKRPWRVNPLG